MNAPTAPPLVPLPIDRPIWDRVFSVFPLVLVGSREADGRANLAPKHLALPMSWDNLFGFVCSPGHATYHNVRRTGVFTVTYPRPSQVLFATLAAAPRADDRTKPTLLALPTFPATAVDGVLVAGGSLFLECRLDQVVDGLGEHNALIIGRVVAASAAADALRDADRDDADLVWASPLLAYLYPGRIAEVRASTAFPFPEGFAR